MKIAKETWIIMAIGVADLATTIVFIQHHGAEEANPLFHQYWEMGLTVFICAKIALLVGPLSVLEWARARRPKFVNWALRSAIVAYLVMYGVGFVKLNRVNAAELQMAERTIKDGETPVNLSQLEHLAGRYHRAQHPAQQTSAVIHHDQAETATVY